MLEKSAMVFICRSQILLKKPGAIRRHVIHRIELITHKGGSHKPDALLRKFCADGMHVAESRREPIEQVRTLGRALNSALLVGGGRWGRRHHFPHEGRSMLRVRCEQ